ncbi:MAG: ATP-binding cassette domain-containing protein [Planctomycetota bacterium]
MLEIKDLHKFYGSFHAVKGISFDVQPGEIVGFLGPNGAGKTTTMKIIVGYMSMSSGDVRVNGSSVVDDSLAVRECIGYLPEHAPIYEDMTVLEYLSFIASMRALKGSRRKERIEYVIGVCALQPKRRASIKTLSKGYRQRVGLAQAIIHEPKLVILDEPTVGLDPNQIIEIRELLRAIGEKNTVVLSSHILSEVEATCSRVIIAADGRIVAQGTPKDLEREHAHLLQWQLRVRGENADIAAALSGLPGVIGDATSVCSDGVATIQFQSDHSEGEQGFAPGLKRITIEGNLVVEELRAERPTLEDVFKTLTAPAATTSAAFAAEEATLAAALDEAPIGGDKENQE